MNQNAEVLKKDIAEAIRLAGYPGFDAPLYSKINNPECGIKLVPKAKKAETEFLVENGLKAPVERSNSERADIQRICARIPRSEYFVLQEVMKDMGITTVDLMINKMIGTALDAWGYYKGGNKNV